MTPIFLQGQILPTYPATALNTVTLYPDSSFFEHSSVVYEEGALFEVLRETRYEHEDAAQNQKFKWYLVKTPDGKKGWIFGDGLAVLLPKDEIKEDLKKYHQQAIVYANGEDPLVAWIASIEGRDNLHEEEHLNPLYKEQYLVLTSPLKKSVHIQLSGFSAMGSNELQQVRFTDINGDDIAEVVLVRNSSDVGSALENRSLEIYAFQAGSIVKIFEERLTLSYESNQPAPSLFKVVNISENTIRVGFVDYVACRNYSLALETNEVSKTQERCMEYATYTYVWSVAEQSYQLLYEESRAALEGVLQSKKGYVLRREPSFLAEAVEHLPNEAPLIIIKHYEKIIKRNDKKVLIPYLYVKTPAGNYGYLHADKVRFNNQEYAEVLQQFYKNPPLLKENWASDAAFLFFKKDLEEVVVNGELNMKNEE